MPGPLSYEPSIGALVADVLPPGTRMVGPANSLRARVSWPILARATGLGEIEGGELVLVPLRRAPELAPRLADLSHAGISGIVFEFDAAEAFDVTSVPVFTLPENCDVQTLVTPIERYIARSRRELFSLDHDMHRLLIDPAIAGATVETLVAAACDALRRPVVLDRDGEIVTSGIVPDLVPHDVLMRARIAIQQSQSGPVWLAEPSAAIAFAIVAGGQRHGIALVLGAGARPDHDEVIGSALASACAIALSRRPPSPVLHLDELIDAVAADAEADPNTQFLVVALADASMDVPTDASAELAHLHRVVGLELGTRDPSAHVGQISSYVVAVVHANVPFVWEHMVLAVDQRLGSRTVRAGVSNAITATDDLQAAFDEAVEALRHSSERVSTYRSIEARSLLARDLRWKKYAEDRLGPLLEDQRTGGALYATLKIYLEEGRNGKAAARDLHIHRNTLVYRLRRISEVLGVDLADHVVLFELELASAALEAGK